MPKKEPEKDPRLEGLRECPFCGSTNLSYREGWLWAFVACNSCGVDGPVGMCFESARGKWDKRS